MKRVYASQDPVAIATVRHVLAEAGIDTRVFNQNTAAVLGEIPFFSAMPEVWVAHDEDADPARDLIRQFETGVVREALRGEPWVCPDCGETIEGQFTHCWRCSDT